MSPGSPGASEGNTDHNWDNSAGMYNQMARMEKIYTLNQINAFETTQSDTVLDIVCGPGRIAVPMEQRAKSVTALDSSAKMLAYCQKNAQAAGVTNLNTLLLDWKEEL